MYVCSFQEEMFGEGERYNRYIMVSMGWLRPKKQKRVVGLHSRGPTKGLDGRKRKHCRLRMGRATQRHYHFVLQGVRDEYGGY